MEIRLNRPDRRNAFQPQMIQELTEVAREVDGWDGMRALILRGEGPSFCAGGDLEWMRSVARFSREENLQDANALFDLFVALSEVSMPILGIAHGHVMGGGLGLLSVCDWVVAEAKTKLSFSEARIGLIPAVIAPFVRRKGHRAVLQSLMIDARVFSSDEAERAGLVNMVVEGDQALENAVEARLRDLEVCAPGALREAKRLLWQMDRSSILSFRDPCTRAIADRRVSAEGQEGLSAFLEKREPAWRGQG